MDRTVGETFYFNFTTRAFATGIPTVLAGSPVLSAIEDNSATPITAGLTLGVSHASVVGLNLITVVATGANGYEAGKDYSIYISTGTVDSVSVVGEKVAEFSLGLSAAFTRLGAPAGASVSADNAAIKVDTAATLTDTTGLNGDAMRGTDSVVLLGPTKTEMDTAHALLSTPAQVNTEVLDVVGTDVIADSVPADGSRMTMMQGIYMIVQFLNERSVSSTTVTVAKVDGSTSLMTFTLDDGTNPTSITRAS